MDLLSLAEGGASLEAITSLWSVEALVALLTLTSLEIVLGIDNIVLVAISVAKLPPEQQDSARRLGLGLAMATRILLLFTLSWVMGLTSPLFSVPKLWTGVAGDLHTVSWRDLILLAGGLFLIFKATGDIREQMEHARAHEGSHLASSRSTSYASVLFQIALMDIVFSLDSVITAVGMVDVHPDHRWVGISIMVAAVVAAVLVMLAFSGPCTRFVKRNPTIKVLALSFMILIGVMLIVEAMQQHIPKGYIYFAMAFSLSVELLNLRIRLASPEESAALAAETMGDEVGDATTGPPLQG